MKALVYTSSHEGVEIEPRNEQLTEETCKMLTEKSTATPHQKSKGTADALVLAANGENLRTAVLRLPPVYGEGDPRLIPSIMGMMRQGKQNMQIGPDQHVFEHVYVGNAVLAHVLCGKALLASSWDPISADGDVAGQAFFITDGQPMSYYTFARKIWYIAGDRTEKANIRLVSFWLVIVTAWMNEILSMPSSSIIAPLSLLTPPQVLKIHFEGLRDHKTPRRNLSQHLQDRSSVVLLHCPGTSHTQSENEQGTC